MKCETTWQCWCKEKNKVKIRKPSLLSPSIMQATCDTCDSKFLLRFSRPPNSDPKQVFVEMRAEHVSGFLETYLEAQKEMNKPKEQMELGGTDNA